MQPVVFISHWTQHIFQHLVANKLDECGILSTRDAFQQTDHDSINCEVKSHWEPVRLYWTLSVSTSFSSSIVCGRPAFSLDVTSSVHCVCIPMASSFFGCHTTLLLCLAGTLHYGYFFFSPPVCCLRVRGAINKHCAFMVPFMCSSTRHHLCSMALHAYIDKLLTAHTSLHVSVHLFNYTSDFLKEI